MACLVLGLLAAPAHAAPAAAAPRPRQTIADYQKEVGLTDQQVQSIATVLGQFKTRVESGQKSLREAEASLQKLVAEHADLGMVRKKLGEIAGLRVDLRLFDVVTSRKVEAVMNAQQLARWRAIQARARAATPQRK